MVGVVSVLSAIVFPQSAVPIAVVIGSAIQSVWRARKRGSAGLEGSGSGNGAESGELQKVALKWKDVTFEAQTKHGEVKVLNNCAGEAKPGRVLAIMGPSGAGKTSLINTLAGQVPYSPSNSLTGTILINEQPKTDATPQAFVQQNPYFFSCLTVQETLEFAARARLPDSVPEETRRKLVEDLILKLGLVKCADRMIGDAKTPGISGGEKRRVAIACEMINTPALVFVDEPTSGLDSFQANQVMASLKTLAEAGHTVICSIHQPRSSIYNMFDDICLISEGETMFCGPVDVARTYFSELEEPVPSNVNPAEHYADMISIDYSSPELEKQSRERVAKFSSAFQKKAAAEISVDVASTDLSLVQADHPHLSWWGQFKMLYARSFKQVTRDKKTFMARMIPCISSAIMFGMIYWRIGNGQSSIQDRTGFATVCVTNAAMLSLTKTVTTFPLEKTLIDRERSAHSFHALPYLLGKVLAELPVVSLPPVVFGSILYPMVGLDIGVKRILSFLSIITVESAAAGAIGLFVGALAPSPEAATAFGPSVMLLFILFGGYYVNSANVPIILRWIPRVSVIRWGFEATAISTLTGVEFDAPNPGDTKSGEQVLERLGFGDVTVYAGLRELVRIAAFFYVAAYGILERKTPAFQHIQDAKDIDAINQQLNNGRIVEVVDEKVASDVQETAEPNGAAKIVAV